MEIKDILKELINVAQLELDQNGQPDNFDLDDFINLLEDYWSELDDIGEFVYSDDDRMEFFGDEDY
jgi:hypothetical protein